jgi:hypothetical protein
VRADAASKADNSNFVLKTYGGRAKAHDGSCPIPEANEAEFLESSLALEGSNQWLLGGTISLLFYNLSAFGMCYPGRPGPPRQRKEERKRKMKKER